MSVIEYKFKNAVDFHRLPFEGTAITVAQVKAYIIRTHKLDQDDQRAITDLEVTNAETGQGTAGMLADGLMQPHAAHDACTDLASPTTQSMCLMKYKFPATPASS